MTTVACSLEMCRFCGDMADLCDLLLIKNVKEVKEELIECWKLKITEDDGLSQHMCLSCNTKFSDYLNFRKECIKAQERLKIIYKNVKSMMGRISIKRICPDYRKEPQNSSINIDNAQIKNIIQTQPQTSEEISWKNIHNSKKSINITQKQISEIQSPKEIFNRMALSNTNSAAMQKNITISNQYAQEKAKESINTRNKINKAHVSENLLTIKNPNQNKNQSAKVSADDTVEFIVFPNVKYSKETITQISIRDKIQQKHGYINYDPLDQIDDNSQSIEEVLNKEITDSLNQPTATCTDRIACTDRTACTDTVTRTFSEMDSFFDETTQSTILSNSIQSDTEDTIKEMTTATKLLKFDDKLIKEIEDSIDETTPLKCKYCVHPSSNGENYPTKTKLFEHIVEQHNPKLPYQCLVCNNRKFQTKQLCLYHITYTHEQNKNICKVCGIGPGGFRRFIGHQERVHSFGDYECETCGKKFENISRARFEYHKKWHNRNQQVQCTYCAKIFVQTAHLKVHEMIHTKNYGIKCEMCDAAFRTQLEKGIHMYKAHGCDKPVKCLYCDNRFTNYNNRTMHMIKMHNHVGTSYNENLKCLKCNKQFKRETGLRNHMQSNCLTTKTTTQKLAARRIKKFVCELCFCRFLTESGLKQHLELHSKEGRPFQCNICHLNYRSRCNLDTHHKIKHNPNKPYQCDICGKWFPLGHIRNNHRKRHKVNLSKNDQMETNVDLQIELSDDINVFNVLN